MKLDKQVFIQEKSSQLEYYFTSSKDEIKKDQMTNYIRLMKNMRWVNFDHYVDSVTSIWKVTFTNGCTMENNQWKNGICNCPVFFKEYICCHLIGIAMRNKICQVPLIAKNIKYNQIII